MNKYVLCVSNKGYEDDLILRRVYEVLPDEKGEAHGMIRVVDETGEDYLFSAGRFVPIDVPEQGRAAFAVKA